MDIEPSKVVQEACVSGRKTDPHALPWSEMSDRDRKAVIDHMINNGEMESEKEIPMDTLFRFISSTSGFFSIESYQARAIMLHKGPEAVYSHVDNHRNSRIFLRVFGAEHVGLLSEEFRNVISGIQLEDELGL